MSYDVAKRRSRGSRPPAMRSNPVVIVDEAGTHLENIKNNLIVHRSLAWLKRYTCPGSCFLSEVRASFGQSDHRMRTQAQRVARW